jgi:hypothetical protein
VGEINLFGVIFLLGNVCVLRLYAYGPFCDALHDDARDRLYGIFYELICEIFWVPYIPKV